jgi:hypothetical protein
MAWEEGSDEVVYTRKARKPRRRRRALAEVDWLRQAVGSEVQ